MSVHRWTGPSRRLCAGRTVLMPSLTGPRQRACEACGTTGVEQRLRTANASTDGAGRRTGLVLSVSWAALVSPRAARGSLFMARAAPPASSSTRGRSFVHRLRRQHRNCERACRSTAPKTRARLPEFRASTKFLDFEGALGRALDNFFTGCISAWSSLCIAALAVWRRELRHASFKRELASIRALRKCTNLDQ